MTNLFLMPLNPKRGLIYSLLALAEATWLGTVLVNWLDEGTFTVPWFLTILSLVIIAVLLGWLTDTYQMPYEMVRGIGVGLAIVGLFLLTRVSLYPEVSLFGWIGLFLSTLFTNSLQLLRFALIITTVGYIWWRCLYIGHHNPTPGISLFTLKIGFVGFSFSIIKSFWTPNQIPFLAATLIFASCIFMAVLLSYSQKVSQTHGEAVSGPWRTQLINALAITLTLLGLSALLSLLLGFPLLDIVFDGLKFVYALFLTVAAGVIIAVAELAAPFVEWMVELLKPGAEEVFSRLETDTSPIAMPESTETVAIETEPSWWNTALIWIFRGGLIAVAVWLFYRFSGQLRQRYQAARQATILGTQEDVSIEGEGLSNLLTGGINKLKEFVSMVRNFGLGKDLKAAATIKRIYAALMVLVAHYNVKRAEYQTPLEFLTPLSEMWPNLDEQFEIITTAYINVHYGQLPEGTAGLDNVKQAWIDVYDTINNEQ